jgi:DNA-binding IclR family transcriptional regulator
MPCLHLTRPQAQRLFGLPADVCERILTTLQADGMLIRGSDDRYRLREGSNKLIRDV